MKKKQIGLNKKKLLESNKELIWYKVNQVYVFQEINSEWKF